MNVSPSLRRFRDPQKCMLAVVLVWSLILASAAHSQDAIESVVAGDVQGTVAGDVRVEIVSDASDTDDDKVETADAEVVEDVALSDVERIIAAGRGDNQAMAHLDYLTNRIGPRLSTSDGLTNACEWVRDTFEDLGLENAQLDEWTQWPVGFNRGPSFGRMIEPEVWALDFATDAWTSGTKGRQRGPALLAPTNEEGLEAIRDKLPGAWVLSPAAPGGRRGGGRTGGGGRRGQRGGTNQGQPAAGQPAAGQRGEGQRGLAQRGQGRRGRDQRRARGFNDPFQQSLRAAYREAEILGTIARRNSEIIVTGGNRPRSLEFLDNLPTSPQIMMTASSYDAIAERLRDGQEVSLEFDIRSYFKKGPIPLYNVMADIPGSQWPEEYVIVCAHLDSWDAGTGATDNGTGCATTIEAARILMAAGVQPKRTIRFMLWSGEEQGMLGSRAYVQANSELMTKISAVLNHDVGTQYISSITALPYHMSDFEEVFAPVMSLDDQFPFRIRQSDGFRGGGSDHASFLRAGVPAFIWGQSGDLARYSDTHHTQLDTYDRAVPAYQEHSSIVVALAAYGIANLDHMLARPDEE